MTEQEFKCFKTYTGLKLYFEGRFDWFKYNGNVGIKPSTYDKRRDKWYFYKLSKRFYDEQELINFFVSNFVYDGTSKWIGDLWENGDVNYQNWRYNTEALTYNFERDCQFIISSLGNKSYVNLFTDGYILDILTDQNIMIETLIIFQECTSFKTPYGTFKPYDLMTGGKISPLWNESLKPLFIKYSPFVKFDQLSMSNIITKYFKSVYK